MSAVAPRLDHEEKRDFRRMNINCPVTLQLSDSGDTLSGHCHDLSGGGVLVSTDRIALPGQRFNLALSGDNPLFSSLKAEAEVVRMLRVENQRFQWGARLIRILT